MDINALNQKIDDLYYRQVAINQQIANDILGSDWSDTEKRGSIERQFSFLSLRKQAQYERHLINTKQSLPDEKSIIAFYQHRYGVAPTKEAARPLATIGQTVRVNIDGAQRYPSLDGWYGTVKHISTYKNCTVEYTVQFPMGGFDWLNSDQVDICAISDTEWDYAATYEPFKVNPILCAICKQEAPIPIDANGRLICSDCDDKVQAYADRLEARRDRLQRAADRAQREGQSAYDHAHKMAEIVPFGQPILIGHHSEGRDRRYRDRIHRTYGRAFKRMEEAQDYERRAELVGKRRAISSDNPMAILQLQDKLAKLEAAQVEHTRLNKIIRSILPKGKTRKQKNEAVIAAHRNHTSLNDLNAQLKAISDEEKALTKTFIDYAPQLAAKANINIALATRLLTPDFVGRVGYADFEISNNSAEIRRIKDRIAELERKQTAALENPETETEQRGNITIERDKVENRIRMIFPGKPAANIIFALKQNGFKWSRNNGAWQRMLTRDAEHAANRVMNVVEGKSQF